MSSLLITNCYHYALIKLAMMLEIDYALCFANLWSETEFDYDPENNVYNSKRLISNLEYAGIKIDILDSATKQERQNNLALLKPGDWMIFGIDCFYLPWHHYFGALHSTHYFPAQQTSQSEFCCFDPMYDKEYLALPHHIVIEHGFDNRRIIQTERHTLQPELLLEMSTIVYSHSNTKKQLIEQIQQYEKEDKKQYTKLARYIDALIGNRRMYQVFLQRFNFPMSSYSAYFDKALFSKWTAVKNGLYKAALLPDNKDLLCEICRLLTQVMDDEITIAKTIQKTS